MADSISNSTDTELLVSPGDSWIADDIWIDGGAKGFVDGDEAFYHFCGYLSLEAR